jgi:hypothetical protein
MSFRLEEPRCANLGILEIPSSSSSSSQAGSLRECLSNDAIVESERTANVQSCDLSADQMNQRDTFRLIRRENARNAVIRTSAALASSTSTDQVGADRAG